MKARVKFNNEIIDVLQVGTKTYLYDIKNIEFLDNPQDYWEKLKHQYAGMAINALLLTNNIRNGDLEGMRECNTNAMAIAHALIEKLKSESHDKERTA